MIYSIIAMPFFGKPKLDPQTTTFPGFPLKLTTVLWQQAVIPLLYEGYHPEQHKEAQLIILIRLSQCSPLRQPAPTGPFEI